MKSYKLYTFKYETRMLTQLLYAICMYSCLFKNKKNNVGMVAINDSFFLLITVYKLVGHFASTHPMYTKLYELFTQVTSSSV